MDFFGAQDQARGRTKYLVALYFAAMLAIIVSIYFVFVFAGFGKAIVQDNQSSSYSSSYAADSEPIDLFNPQLFLAVAGGVVLVIAGASLYKISSLGKGGAAIAESVGGRQIDMSTNDPDERKLLNIVEEMSIASGTPMPDVFVLEGESGINAFAAGYDLNDAAIAVTHGAIRQLSRDELQGVIAHEFSHIHSGDMRLNIRLIGPLFGLLVVAFIGRMFLYSGSGRSRDKNQGNLALVGLAIMVIGYIGVIFGRLIQAAISRQREYLADASAVQFTRNPEGIANALRRLGYTPEGSKIGHAHAEDTAHMFFAQALGSSLSTHPPLPKRIRAVLPDWDGSFLPPRKEKAAPEQSNPAQKSASFGAGGPFTTATAIAAVGALTENHLREGIERKIRIHKVLGDIPFDHPSEAQITFTALILTPDSDDFAQQIHLIGSERGSEFADRVKDRALTTSQLSASDCFAIMELCFPGLRKISQPDRPQFIQILQQIADADGQLSLRESLVLEVVQRQFGIAQAKQARSQRLEKNVEKLSAPISELLYLIAHLENEENEEVQRIFEAAVKEQYLLSPHISFPANATPTLKDLSGILTELNKSSFAIRKQVLEAAATIVLSDDKTTDQEWTILRLVSLSLGVPMPPLPT
ncbi:MAG: M48 family metallopeptidase [Puniceicoccales bacterium]